MIENIEDSLGLKFKIDGIADANKMIGGVSSVLFLHIDNIKNTNREIYIKKCNYITTGREQIEQDFFESGFLSEKGTLNANTISKVGLGFYKSKLKKISNSDRIYTTIGIEAEGIEVLVCFIKEEGVWRIMECQKTFIQKEIDPRQLEKNLLSRIERLEVFEEKFGVSIQSLSVKYGSDRWFRIFYELHPLEGTGINNRISVECVCYDNEGSIIFKTSDSFNPKDFFGFEVVQIYVEPIEVSRVSKIRLYPKN